MRKNQRGPTVVLRNASERAIRVDGKRVSDSRQHRHVRFRVGVGTRVREIEGAFTRKRSHCNGLIVTLAEKFETTGVAAALINFGPRGDGTGDADDVSEGLDNLGRR